MTQTKDNIIDRDQLQDRYINEIIDGMDHKWHVLRGEWL